MEGHRFSSAKLDNQDVVHSNQKKMGSGMSIALFFEPDYEGIEEWGQIYFLILHGSGHLF